MTSPLIDVSIMAHPSRTAAAEELRAQLASDFVTRVVYDPDPNGPHSTVRTARLAWKPHHPSATHHLLVQDDAVLSPDFGESIRQIVRAHPNRWISLACEWGSKTAWVCRTAALAHRPYGPIVDSYVPLWGLLMPRADADALADFLRDVDLGEPDDKSLAEFASQREMSQPLMTIPNLLSHGTLPSLIGNDDVLGPRETALAIREPIPDGWWDRQPLDVKGAPVMIYWMPTKPFTLCEPGHNGYDVHSSHFGAQQRSTMELAWKQFGVQLEGNLARAFTIVCLTYVEGIRFAARQQLSCPDPRFGSVLVDEAVRSLVQGMFRSLFHDETRGQAPRMIEFISQLR